MQACCITTTKQENKGYGKREGSRCKCIQKKGITKVNYWQKLKPNNKTQQQNTATEEPMNKVLDLESMLTNRPDLLAEVLTKWGLR